MSYCKKKKVEEEEEKGEKNATQQKSSSRETHILTTDCYCNRVKKLRNYMLLWNLCKRWQFSGTIYFETKLLAHKSASSC